MRMKDFYAPRNIGTLFSDLYPADYFDIISAQEACAVLNWARSSFLRLAENKLKTGQIVKSGQSRATRYEIAASSLRPSAAQFDFRKILTKNVALAFDPANLF